MPFFVLHFLKDKNLRVMQQVGYHLVLSCVCGSVFRSGWIKPRLIAGHF